MEKMAYILSLGIPLLSVFALAYEIWQSIKLNKLRKASSKDLYVRNLDFGLAMNSGDDPCKIKEPFELPEFSQDCDYLV